MSNLIPTVITDVNGKVTTVHKRATGQAPHKNIPAPQPLQLTPKLAARQAMKDFEAVGVNLRDTPQGNKSLFHLAKHYPKSIPGLLKRMRNACDRERLVWEHILSNTDMSNQRRSVMDMTPYNYRKWLNLLPMTMDLFPSTPRIKIPEGAMLYTRINSLSETVSQLLKTQGHIADDDKYNRVKAVMIVTQVNKEAGHGGSVAGREDDIEFIRQNMESVTPIVLELMRRGTTDPALVEQIMNSSAKSLNDGIL